MQPVVAPPQAGKVAFQYGLIFGIIQAVIASAVLLVNDLVITSVSQVGVSLTLSIVSFLTSLAAYFVAGIFSARQTGKVSTGTFGGMWTGAIYGLIDLVVSLVLFFQIALPKVLNSPLATNSANPDAFRTGATIGGVGFAIFGVLFAVGLGAGLGSLGGLIGRNISNVQPVPAYPAYPVAPQPLPYAPPQPAGSEQIYPQQPIRNPYTDQ